MKLPLAVVLAAVLIVVAALPAHATSEASPRFLVHLLGYIKQDYGGAVAGGKVLSPSEYNEQQEFLHSAIETSRALSVTKEAPDVQAGLRRLEILVDKKADAAEVAGVAQTVEDRVIALAHLDVAPIRWPNLAHGKELFDKNCAQCHGATGHGNGPSSGSLNPKPANFHDAKMSDISPFQAFNAIRLGVPGTAMTAFPTISDRQTWDLAFYVLSLRYEGQPAGNAPEIPLAVVASSSDAKLSARLPETGRALALASLRLKSGKEVDSASFLPIARASLDEVIASAAQNDWSRARSAAVVAYLEGIEPVEPRLRARDAAFTAALEQRMAEVRSATLQRSLPKLEASVADARLSIDQAESLLEEKTSSPAFTFTVAAGIFLREAFEAALILITLLGVLRSLGTPRAALFVHAGWILAVACGLAAWFLSGWLVAISGAQREMLEGSISLLAVVVLLYVGFWLHRKTEIGKWRAFIGEMVKAAVEEKNLYILGGVAFMAVFREAFETVLFLRALLVEAGEHQEIYVGAGVLASFLLVVVLASALVRFSAKIPLRQLFTLSSLVMIALAFVLLGKSMHSFQELGFLPVTTIPLGFRIDLIGLYPTLETLFPQFMLLTGAVFLWAWSKRPARLKERPVG